MSDPKANPELESDINPETFVRISGTDELLDLSKVLVVDPQILRSDTDPHAEWVREATEAMDAMDTDEWTAWNAQFQAVAA